MSTGFHNSQIPTVELPTAADVIFERLHPNYKKVSVNMTAIFFVILLLVYFVLGYFIGEILSFPYILIAMIAWSVVTGLAVVFSVKGYDYQGFALREKDIIYKSGILFRSTVIVPFNRVQHCEIEQGPIDRMFDLAELSIFTAGGSASDISVPGLTLEKANAMKKFITNRTIEDEEE